MTEADALSRARALLDDPTPPTVGAVSVSFFLLLCGLAFAGALIVLLFGPALL